MNIIKDFLTTPEYSNTSTMGRVVSALTGIAVIGIALSEKKASTLSKWLKIGGGAVLVLRAISGFHPVNKALGANKTN